MKNIKIFSLDEPGFKVAHSFENWQIGVIRYANGLEKASIERLEKHSLTDEDFILLNGEASLFIGEELKETIMKSGFIYNIPKNTWHTISLSKDATVLVFENANTEICDKIKFIE